MPQPNHSRSPNPGMASGSRHRGRSAADTDEEQPQHVIEDRGCLFFQNLSHALWLKEFIRPVGREELPATCWQHCSLQQSGYFNFWF